MQMNISIILNNNNELKVFLPLAKILEKKYKIFFFIDNWKSFSNKKKYLIPSERIIKQQFVSYNFFFFHNKKELAKLIKTKKIKKIFSLFWPTYYLLKKNCRWIGVPLANDLYQRGNLENLNEFDKILTYTKKQGLNVLKYLSLRLDKYSSSKKVVLLKYLSKKFIPVGNISLNQHKIGNKKILLNKYNLSNKKKYLLLFLHDSWAYRNPENIFLMNLNFVEQIFYLIRNFNYRNFLFFLKKIRFSKVFNSIENFASLNNLEIIIKSRKKSILPSFLKKKKIKIFFDEDYYPSTTLELISISDVCFLTYVSSLINECAFLNKPLILIAPEDEQETNNDMLYYNTKISQKTMFNNSYINICSKMLRIKPLEFIRSLSKEKKNSISIFNKDINNEKFIKEYIYEGYSTKNYVISANKSKILNI
jgi:hypothetical protein